MKDAGKPDGSIADAFAWLTAAGFTAAAVDWLGMWVVFARDQVLVSTGYHWKDGYATLSVARRMAENTPEQPFWSYVGLDEILASRCRCYLGGVPTERRGSGRGVSVRIRAASNVRVRSRGRAQPGSAPSNRREPTAVWRTRARLPHIRVLDGCRRGIVAPYGQRNAEADECLSGAQSIC